jgi:hypothetical protein
MTLSLVSFRSPGAEACTKAEWGEEPAPLPFRVGLMTASSLRTAFGIIDYARSRCDYGDYERFVLIGVHSRLTVVPVPRTPTRYLLLASIPTRKHRGS